MYFIAVTVNSSDLVQTFRKISETITQKYVLEFPKDEDFHNCTLILGCTKTKPTKTRTGLMKIECYKIQFAKKETLKDIMILTSSKFNLFHVTTQFICNYLLVR